jgi:membrane protease YdiL (CAAX protease family)
MDELRDGIEQLFWHRGEKRLRAPFRIGVTLFAALLVLVALGTTVSVLGLLGGPSGPVTAAIGEALLLVAFALLFLVIVRRVDRRRLRDIGLQPTREWLRDLGAGFALGGVMAAAVVLAALLSGLATVEGTLVTREGELFAGLSIGPGLAVGFVLFVLFATLEEVAFRGYLLVNVAEGARGIVDDRTAVLVGLAVTAVLFGLVHALNPGASVLSALNITLFGLLLGAAYVLTDRLAVPIGLHVAWNFALGSVFGTPVSGLTTGAALVAVELGEPAFLTGGGFGPEGGLLAVVALAAGAAGLAAWVRRSTGAIAVVERIAQPDLWTRT